MLSYSHPISDAVIVMLQLQQLPIFPVHFMGDSQACNMFKFISSEAEVSNNPYCILNARCRSILSKNKLPPLQSSLNNSR